MSLNLYRLRFGVVLFVVCGGLLAGGLGLPRVRAVSPGAYFSGVLASDGFGSREVLGGGVAKVYSGQAPVWENTSFYNNITNPGTSIFYEVIYVTTGNTTLSFTGDSLTVPQKTLFSYNWEESGGFAGSGYISIRIELWLNNTMTTPVLEDTVQFQFLVVLLQVSGWNESQASVQRGLTAPLRLTLGFTNGGNDVMYNVSLALLDSAGLAIQPYVYSLGNIQAGQGSVSGFNVTASATSSLGVHDAVFRISFNDFRGVKHTTNETGFINVVSLGTQITVAASPPVIKVNEYSSLKITLLDNNLNPVPNADLNLDIGGDVQVTLTTDSSGSVVYLYQAKNASGIYLLRASYAGNANLGASSGSGILTVNSIGTRLSLNAPANSALGQSAALSATLLDETGRPVVGANVTFLVNGVTVGWAFTDASGVGVFNYFSRTNGVLSVSAAYLGSSTYSGANSGTSSMYVSPASLLVIGGVDLTLPVFLVFASAILILTLRSLRAHWKEQSLLR